MEVSCDSITQICEMVCFKSMLDTYIWNLENFLMNLFAGQE